MIPLRVRTSFTEVDGMISRVQHLDWFAGDADLHPVPNSLDHHGMMILEHALLPVKPGEEANFESAFTQAAPIIAGMSGFRGLILSRAVARPSTYLLLVKWDRLEDHIEGFRGSPQYQQWRMLLHRFYQPLPVVEHFQQVCAR